MIKIMGCILIFASCTGLGFLKAAAYKDRRRELEHTLELIHLLEMEITYKKDSLAKTFQKVSLLKHCWFGQVLETCGRQLADQKPLQQAWQAGLEENRHGCPLLPGDLQILQDISLGLGKSDAQGQKKVLESAVLRLKAKLRDAVLQEEKQGRMYRGLGMAAGVVIAVILL